MPVIKAYGGEKAQLYSFLISALDRPLYPRGEIHRTLWIGVAIGSIVCLDAFEMRFTSASTFNRTTTHRTSSLGTSAHILCSKSMTKIPLLGILIYNTLYSSLVSETRVNTSRKECACRPDEPKLLFMLSFFVPVKSVSTQSFPLSTKLTKNSLVNNYSEGWGSSDGVVYIVTRLVPRRPGK